MKPATITKAITIDAPPDRVWQLVGSESGLRQWWQCDVTFEARRGGRCSERGVVNGKRYRLEGTVAVYDPPHQLVMHFTDAHSAASRATAMDISITLDEVAGATVVRVVHQMYELLPALPTRQPGEPAYPRPLGQPPTILNQLPGHTTPTQENDALLPSAGFVQPAGLDRDHVAAFEARWTARLVGLRQLLHVKGESQ